MSEPKTQKAQLRTRATGVPGPNPLEPHDLTWELSLGNVTSTGENCTSPDIHPGVRERTGKLRRGERRRRGGEEELGGGGAPRFSQRLTQAPEKEGLRLLSPETSKVKQSKEKSRFL